MTQQTRDREINFRSLEPRPATITRPATPTPVDVGTSRITTRRSQLYFSSMSRKTNSEFKPNASYKKNANTTVQAKCHEYTSPLEANEKYIRHIYTARGLQPSAFRPNAVSKLYNRSEEASKIILSCNPDQQHLERSMEESNQTEFANKCHIPARPMRRSRQARQQLESRYSPEPRPELDVCNKSVRFKTPYDQVDNPNRSIDERPNKYEDRTFTRKATANRKKVQGMAYGVGYSNMNDRVLPSSFLPPQLTAPANKGPNRNPGHNQQTLGIQESEEDECPHLAKDHFTQLSSSVFKALAPLNGTKTRSVFEKYKTKPYAHDASSAPGTMFKLRETHKPQFQVNSDYPSNKQVFANTQPGHLGKRHFDTCETIVRENSGSVDACKRFECAGTFNRRKEGRDWISPKERFAKEVPKGAIVSKDYEGFKKYWSFTDTFNPNNIETQVQPCYYMETNVHRSGCCGNMNKGVQEIFHNEKYDETSASSLPFVSLPPSKTQIKEECTTKRRPNAVVCKDNDCLRTRAHIPNHQAEHPTPTILTSVQQCQGHARQPMTKNWYDSTAMRDVLYWPAPDVHEQRCPSDQHGVGDKRDKDDNTRKRGKQSWINVNITHSPQEEKFTMREDDSFLATVKDGYSKASTTVCIQRKIPSTYAFAYTKPMPLSGREDPEALSFRPNIKKHEVDNVYHKQETIYQTSTSVSVPKEKVHYPKTTRNLSYERTNTYCLLPTASSVTFDSINPTGTKNAYSTRDKSNNSRRPLSGVNRVPNEQDKKSEQLRRIKNIIDSRTHRPMKLIRRSEGKKLNAHDTVQSKRGGSLEAKSRNGAIYRPRARTASNSYHASKENVRQMRKSGSIRDAEKQIRRPQDIQIKKSVSGALLKSTYKNVKDASSKFAKNMETIIGRSRSKQTKIERPSDGKYLPAKDVIQARYRNVSIESNPTRDYNTRHESERNCRTRHTNIEDIKNGESVFDSEKTKALTQKELLQQTKVAKTTRLDRHASETKTSSERNVDGNTQNYPSHDVDCKPRHDPEHDPGVGPSKEEHDLRTKSTALDFSRLSLHYQHWLASPQSSAIKTKLSRKIIQRFKNTVTQPMVLPTVPG